MTEPGPTDQETPFPLYLFRFTGRLRPAQYFCCVAAAFAALIAAFALGASAMAPTGGGGAAVLAIPLLIVFVWIMSAAIVQRLRDAGRSATWSLVFILGLLLLFPGLELIEYAGLPLALIFIALLVTPGLMKPVNAPVVLK